eukprot:Rhum_TRINITY_DN6258_c0_g1::Rhum_TRINITY_DN6258_c0_g1_i1::g.19519::m.19519
MNTYNRQCMFRMCILGRHRLTLIQGRDLLSHHPPAAPACVGRRRLARRKRCSRPRPRRRRNVRRRSTRHRPAAQRPHRGPRRAFAARVDPVHPVAAHGPLCLPAGGAASGALACPRRSRGRPPHGEHAAEGALRGEVPHRDGRGTAGVHLQARHNTAAEATTAAASRARLPRVRGGLRLLLLRRRPSFREGGPRRTALVQRARHRHGGRGRRRPVVVRQLVWRRRQLGGADSAIVRGLRARQPHDHDVVADLWEGGHRLAGRAGQVARRKSDHLRLSRDAQPHEAVGVDGLQPLHVVHEPHVVAGGLGLLRRRLEEDFEEGLEPRRLDLLHEQPPRLAGLRAHHGLLPVQLQHPSVRLDAGARGVRPRRHLRRPHPVLVRLEHDAQVLVRVRRALDDARPTLDVVRRHLEKHDVLVAVAAPFPRKHPRDVVLRLHRLAVHRPQLAARDAGCGGGRVVRAAGHLEPPCLRLWVVHLEELQPDAAAGPLLDGVHGGRVGLLTPCDAGLVNGCVCGGQLRLRARLLVRRRVELHLVVQAPERLRGTDDVPQRLLRRHLFPVHRQQALVGPDARTVRRAAGMHVHDPHARHVGVQPRCQPNRLADILEKQRAIVRDEH